MHERHTLKLISQRDVHIRHDSCDTKSAFVVVQTTYLACRQFFFWASVVPPIANGSSIYPKTERRKSTRILVLFLLQIVSLFVECCFFVMLFANGANVRKIGSNGRKWVIALKLPLRCWNAIIKFTCSRNVKHLGDECLSNALLSFNWIFFGANESETWWFTVCTLHTQTETITEYVPTATKNLPNSCQTMTKKCCEIYSFHSFPSSKRRESERQREKMARTETKRDWVQIFAVSLDVNSKVLSVQCSWRAHSSTSHNTQFSLTQNVSKAQLH